MPSLPSPKPVEFVGTSRTDLQAFPEPVRLVMGHAIFMAQVGQKHSDAKPLRGQEFKGAGVLEVVDDYDGDTFRAVYTVRFAGVVYVLHAFQKKAKSGIATPKQHVALIKQRLRSAREHYEETYARN